MAKKDEAFYPGHVNRYLARRLTDIFIMIFSRVFDSYAYPISENDPWYRKCFYKQEIDKRDNIRSLHPTNLQLIINQGQQLVYISYIATVNHEMLFLKSFFKDYVDSVARCYIDNNGNVLFFIFSYRLQEYVKNYLGVNYWDRGSLIEAQILSGAYDEILFSVACHEIRHLLQSKYSIQEYLTISDNFYAIKDVEYPSDYLEWLDLRWNIVNTSTQYRYCTQASKMTIILKKEEDAFVVERMAELVFTNYAKRGELRVFWEKTKKLLFGELSHPF